MTVSNSPAGLVLDDRERACGICGRVGKLSRTHVPPQAAGNTHQVRRTDMRVTATGVGPGRWVDGGMWMRGLCAGCNSFAGGRYDKAYADFAGQLQHWMETGSRIVVPGSQAVTLAPGRVTRSVLSGTLGISPHIRALNPTLAEQVELGGPVRLPGGMALRVAVYMGTSAQLTGPMLTGFADGSGDPINTLASVTFRPLSWALVTTNGGDPLAARGWQDATDWLRYEDDREALDLRWLAPGGVSVAPTVLHASSDNGVQLYSSEITPIMIGRLPR